MSDTYSSEPVRVDINVKPESHKYGEYDGYSNYGYGNGNGHGGHGHGHGGYGNGGYGNGFNNGYGNSYGNGYPATKYYYPISTDNGDGNTNAASALWAGNAVAAAAGMALLAAL